MAAAMARLAADGALVDRLGRHGRTFAQTFTWERAAEETLAHLGDEVHQGGAQWKSSFTRTTR